ncbi:hypothetical protein PILCRDRAFT_533400 [Piloderma croceum F 1598]|uniref:Uncharacterized protein n=1 Tax=Piloderma croceum (strain F 1598) TaxID=765440 RepID=A0A0C3FLR1_PILCF|nr:hypothetical protein PILCRDRAFT_533400 [Piloderma croceum F 1598]
MLGPQTIGDWRQQVKHQSQRMGVNSVMGYKLCIMCKCQNKSNETKVVLKTVVKIGRNVSQTGPHQCPRCGCILCKKGSSLVTFNTLLR